MRWPQRYSYLRSNRARNDTIVTRTHAQNDRQSVRPGPRKVVRDGGEIEPGCRTCARIVQVHHAGTETGGHAQVQRCSSITVLRIWIRPSLEKHLRWPSTPQGNFIGENRVAAFSPFATAKKMGASIARCSEQDGRSHFAVGAGRWALPWGMLIRTCKIVLWSAWAA
jgi:hypothetical protein